MKMRLLFISIFIFGISISVLAQDLIHTDSTNGFNVATPEGWSDTDLAGRMVWHVASNNGTELPDCGVIVTDDWRFAAITQEEYASSQSEAQLKKLFSLNFSDVAIGLWEPNFPFAETTALHYIVSVTSEKFRQTSISFQIIHDRKLYTLFCNAPAGKFANLYLELLGVADSFSFVQSNTPEGSFNKPALLSSYSQSLGAEVSDTIIQWAIIIVVLLFIPYAYWHAVKRGRLHIVPRLLSYFGAVLLGAIAAVFLIAAKVIGVGALFGLVVALFSVAHHYALRYCINIGKLKSNEETWKHA